VLAKTPTFIETTQHSFCRLSSNDQIGEYSSKQFLCPSHGPDLENKKPLFPPRSGFIPVCLSKWNAGFKPIRQTSLAITDLHTRGSSSPSNPTLPIYDTCQISKFGERQVQGVNQDSDVVFVVFHVVQYSTTMQGGQV
jgi:hypothetical protein